MNKFLFLNNHQYSSKQKKNLQKFLEWLSFEYGGCICFSMFLHGLRKFKDFSSNADVLLFNHSFILLKSDLGWKLPSVGLSLYYNSAILIYSCSPSLFLPLNFFFLPFFS